MRVGRRPGPHYRRRAYDLAVEDPELEFRRWLEQRELAGGQLAACSIMGV